MIEYVIFYFIVGVLFTSMFLYDLKIRLRPVSELHGDIFCSSLCWICFVLSIYLSSVVGEIKPC